MKLGFSGTQEGMTESQKIVTTAIAAAFMVEGVDEFHHGCCIGSDEDFHRIIRLISESVPIHGHPPIVTTKVSSWAMDDCNDMWLPRPYLDRDRDIADVCDRLIATPKENAMIRRSGTWATVGYFIQNAKPIYVIKPDGKLWSRR